MRMLLISLLLTFSCLSAQAQKTKRFDVCQTGLFHVFGRVNFTGDTPLDTTYHVLGRDSRYQQLVEFIYLRHGQLNDIYSFFHYCGEFLNKEEKGTSIDYAGNYLSVNRLMGMKYINIYGIEQDADGYTTFGAPQISNVLTGIEYFCKRKHIALVKP